MSEEQSASQKEKSKNNSMSQEVYEQSQMAWHRGILKKTQAMTKKQGKGWQGEPTDVPAARVKETPILKKKGKK